MSNQKFSTLAAEDSDDDVVGFDDLPNVFVRRNRTQRVQSMPLCEEVAHLFDDEEAAEDFLLNKGCFNIPTHCREQCGEPIYLHT